MARWFCVAVILLLASAAALAHSESEDLQQMLQLVNRERTKRGLPALELDERLSQAAREHSVRMAEQKKLAHQLDGEPTVQVRLGGTGVRFNRSGENVAMDSDAASAHQTLMDSPPHRANILTPEYNAIGIAVVRRGDYVWVTQNFVHRLPTVSVDAAEDTVAQAFARMRQSAGSSPLRRVEEPRLREAACSMAASDSINPKFANGITGAKNIVVFTATDLNKLPAQLTKLRSVYGGGYSVGACFAPSASYTNPVFWFAFVLYFPSAAQR